jgi:hypothetical protein
MDVTAFILADAVPLLYRINTTYVLPVNERHYPSTTSMIAVPVPKSRM